MTERWVRSIMMIMGRGRKWDEEMKSEKAKGRENKRSEEKRREGN